MTARWTDADLVRAWQLGREYQPPGLAEVADDIRHAPSLAPPQQSHAERIAARIAEMEWHAERVAEIRDEAIARNRAHDRATIERGSKLPPLTWADVRAMASPEVWARIQSDLGRSPTLPFGGST